MSKFSKKSLAELSTCHPDLQRLFNEVIKHYECTVLCGHRNMEDQNKAVQSGASKLAWPKSKHNKTPSLAVDVIPFPVDWKDLKRFMHFAGVVQGVAFMMGIKIRWGGDFNEDLDFKNDKFIDMPHFELAGDK